MKPSTKPNGAPPSTAKQHTPADEAPATNGKAGKRPMRKRTGERIRIEPSPYAESLLERCASIPRLQAFSSAIGTAGLADLLRGDGPITIFAPTDRAFDKIPLDERTALLANSVRLAELLRHHVVNGRVKAPRQTKPRSVTPEFGDELTLTASPDGFHVDEARIVKTNIRATNGVIHAIDTVLDPR
jgi:uncharacterized surface protein with fasciclin (FAS1) repeats